MNVQLPMYLDKQAFLAWVQVREERYELASGRVIQVGPNTRRHGLLTAPALAAYIVLSQDEPKAWVWRRSASGFSPGPDVITRLEETVRIPALSVSLPFSDVYRGIALD
jgi:hypothetical protein